MKQTPGYQSTFIADDMALLFNVLWQWLESQDCEPQEAIINKASFSCS